MHTFFINTSQKELNEYDILFDVHYENKALVSMNYPMSDWYDENKGYKACVNHMSEMIEGYVELGNAFNLIIYIDLPENKAYSSIPRDAFHDKEREECCRAMHILFTHVINESILKELEDSGRRPQNVLIMFGEEKKFTDFSVAPHDPGRPGIMKWVLNFIGLPDEDAVEKIARAVSGGDAEDKVSAFEKEILAVCGAEIVPGIRGIYHRDLRLWCDEVINEARIDRANISLFERIDDADRAKFDRTGVDVLSCPYDCYACRVNKSVLALSELNVALHVLKCVEAHLALDDNESVNRDILQDFRVYTIKEIAPVLKEKMDIYSDKVAEIEAMSESYADLGLAPRLSAFDNAKFGLDVYGDKATDLVVSDVTADDREKGAAGEEASEDDSAADDAPVKRGNEKELLTVSTQAKPLFSKDEYQPFEYTYEVQGDPISSKTTPEQYVEQAKKVKRHHLDYLKRLKIHVSQTLSHYAGKSKENKPALLQVGGYRYAASGEEKKVLEAVETVSDKAYKTMITQYMEFCAGRSVAISDIDEQCNWFVTRVHQIKESLRKISIVAIGLLIAIIALYIPFVVIQFDAIFENAVTLATALGSIAVPIALLCAIFVVVTALQRKKYAKAWKDFVEKSNEALAENKIAVQKYDQLLSTIVPALRWVYEYKLDVDYCVECCSIADAKVEHHRQKLRKRVTAIQNILSDLEFRITESDGDSSENKDVTDAVDYTTSFCTGQKNRKFYSVIDASVLNRSSQ